MKKLLLLLFLIPNLMIGGEKIEECRVYWDGWKFKEGKVSKSDGYKTIKLAKHGIHVLSIAIPKKMSTFLACDDLRVMNDPFDLNGNECQKFLGEKYQYEISKICE